MKKFVAVSAEDEVNIHLPDPSGNYATLCGLDGDDPDEAVRQHVVEVPKGAKVDCVACKKMWEVARRYQPADFK